MVKLIFPISFKDYNQVIWLARRIASFETTKDRDAIAVYCWGDQWEAELSISALKGAFRTVHQWIYPDPPEGGEWPDASNHLFYSTARRLAEFSNDCPWMWFEADCFPLQSCFLEALEKGYEKAKYPYMGVVNSVRYKNSDEEGGPYMMGAGIYPPDFITVCNKIHFVPEGVPWDVWIRDEVVPDCIDTPLIYHAWNTGKYHLVEGELIGKDLPNSIGVSPKYGGKPINHKAVVLHGLKDTSLYKIDLTQWNANLTPNG